MTILRLAPTVLESYSTVSILPRSMLSRRASKPFGAGASEAGESARVKAARTKNGLTPSRRLTDRFIVVTSQKKERAEQSSESAAGLLAWSQVSGALRSQPAKTGSGVGRNGIA